jgi:hypothetical protein
MTRPMATVPPIVVANDVSRIRKVDFPSRVKGGRGYLLVDNRANGGGYQEMPTMTCNHCNSVVVLNDARTRPRAVCRRCNAYVCDKCGALGECNPTDEGIELALRYPGQGTFIARGDDGRILFDPRLRDKGRVH